MKKQKRELFQAIHEKNTYNIEKLAKQGVKLDIKSTQEQNNLIQYSLRHDNPEIAKFLLNHYSSHFDINYQNNKGQTILHLCAENYNIPEEFTHWFIQTFKPDLYLKDNGGNNSLYVALSGDMDYFYNFYNNLNSLNFGQLFSLRERIINS